MSLVWGFDSEKEATYIELRLEKQKVFSEKSKDPTMAARNKQEKSLL